MNHGGQGVEYFRIWSGDANANCLADFPNAQRSRKHAVSSDEFIFL